MEGCEKNLELGFLMTCDINLSRSKAPGSLRRGHSGFDTYRSWAVLALSPLSPAHNRYVPQPVSPPPQRPESAILRGEYSSWIYSHDYCAKIHSTCVCVLRRACRKSAEESQKDRRVTCGPSAASPIQLHSAAAHLQQSRRTIVETFCCCPSVFHYPCASCFLTI